ncbi:MAG: glycosyltransferase [Longimicrobiales bacterium]
MDLFTDALQERRRRFIEAREELRRQRGPVPPSRWVRLPETSLCAIVRDELHNPAGGIRRFVEAIMPHVQAGVVVDTGSADGTREALEELRVCFPELEVYDRPFDDFPSSRNFSLRKVRTRRALVLDADELILHADFEELELFMRQHPLPGYGFLRIEVEPGGRHSIRANHNPRLFEELAKVAYRTPEGHTGEQLFLAQDATPRIEGRLGADRERTVFASVPIYHFLPDAEGLTAKHSEWYEQRASAPPLSSLPGFHAWKALNPQRERFE